MFLDQVASDAVFSLGLSLLLVHELDAVRAQEWRLLPILRRMPELVGRDVFILVHVPLIALLIWFALHSQPIVRLRFQVAADLFFLLHVGLHRAFRSHPHYDFHSLLSRGLILGAGATGIVHLSIIARNLAVTFQ